MAVFFWFDIEIHHRLHADRTVAAPLRHLRADRLWDLLAGDAKGHLQSRHVDLFFDPPPVATNDTGIRTLDGGGRIRAERQSGMASSNWTRRVKP